ncbi:MAG: M15 family peptidase, partial [Actinomycetota bacterium]|nr:M15 family peptidase [Actinomycetota bacterium]
MAATAVLVQCAPAPDPVATGSPQALAPETVRTVAQPPPRPVTPPTPVPAPAQVAAVTAADLGTTWRPGCPVPAEQLRRVDLDYRGFDGDTHRGQLVVHQDVASAVVEIFAELYRMGYPVERMRTVENYPGADDELSMRDNNTSAFNCRDIPGTGQRSYHAYGRAID